MKTLFWRLHQRGLHDLCGRKVLAKVAKKLFGQVWGNSGKILRTPNIATPRGGARGVTGGPLPPQNFAWPHQKFSAWRHATGVGLFLKVLHRPLTAPLVAKLAPPVAPQMKMSGSAPGYTYDEKAPPPRCPLLKGQMGKCHRHASILWHHCAYYSTRTLFSRCCKLQCVTAMKMNNHRRSLKTKQFMTAKVFGIALKQVSRAHWVLHHRSSQQQKYKAALMSGRIAVDQKVCGWDGRHPGLTVWNLRNYTRIENAHIVRKKTFVFCYVAVIRTIFKGRKDTGLCESLWSIRLKCHLMTILETKHILQAQVCDCISTKNETGN